MKNGELHMLRPENFNASSQDFQGKNKPATSKEPKYISKYTPGSEVVDPDCWMKLCALTTTNTIYNDYCTNTK